jgi:hypothetical protein
LRSRRILEVVERGEALEKIRLRGRGSRVLERDHAQVLLRCVQRQPRDQRRNGGNDDPKIHVRSGNEFQE